MNPASVHKKFIFNEKIDEDWLRSLYEEDYAYIAEIFGTSLEAIREDLPQLMQAYESSDISALQKAVHKIKPVFGFAGLLHHQEMMARFEHSCTNVSNPANLTMQYIELTDLLREGKNILQDDYNRLTAFLS